MKSLNTFKNFSSLFLFSCSIFCGTLFADNASLSQVKVIGGTVITAWQGQDSTSGFATIEASVGSISTDPSTWTHTVFTSTTDYATTAPFLTTNANGDALIVYEFYDTINSYCLTNAAMLPAGTSTWAVNTISDPANFADQGDQVGSIDESGNIAVTWANYNFNTEGEEVVVATSAISATPTWSYPPVKISQ